MELLAIDTASPSFIAVAFGTGDETPIIDQREAPRDQSRQLLSSVERVLGGRRPGAVVVVTGPGSFAGLRVGIATGRGIAMGLGVPVCGVATLDAVWAAAGESAYVTVAHPMGREMMATRAPGAATVTIVSAATLAEAAGVVAGEGAAALGGRDITAGERCAAALTLAANEIAAGRIPGPPTAVYSREPNITKPKLSA